MAEENESMALAPSHVYLRSDEEFAMPTTKPISSNRGNNKCFVYLLCLIVILSIFALVFSIFFFKPINQEFQITSVTPKNVQQIKSGHFNATLLTEFMIKNKNYGKFKYPNTMGSVVYSEQVVGDIKIANGSVKARKTKKFNVTVDVRYNRLSNTDSLNDAMNSGIVELSSFVQLKGSIHIFDVLKVKKMTAVLFCTMNLDLRTQTISGLGCH